MKITDSRVTPVSEDSRVAIRQRTAIGENYVAITPGRSTKSLPNAGLLAMTQADEYVDVDQVLSVLQGGTRERARRLIQGLGGAIAGDGPQLRGLLGGTSGVIINTADIMRVLDGHRSQIPALVQHLGDITAAVGARGAAIRQLAQGGLTTFAAIAQRDSALRTSIDLLPSTLRAVRSLTGTLGSVSASATPVVTALSGAVAELKSTVSLLPMAARGGIQVTSSLGAASPRLQQLLHDVTPLSKLATTALPDLQQTLCQAQPAVRYLQPYIKDVTAAVTNLGSSANAYDALGHLVRLEPVVNDNTLVGLPDSISSAAFNLIHAGLLARQTSITYDPYPKPGLIGTARAPITGQILGPAQLPRVYKYPRLLSAC
jgi:phospholipid/cholesterol/gamma-HCH transport system substrate-binding protein